MKLAVQVWVLTIFLISSLWSAEPLSQPDSVELGAPFDLHFVVNKEVGYRYSLDSVGAWQGFTKIISVDESETDSTYTVAFSLAVYQAPQCTVSLPALVATPLDSTDTTLLMLVDTLGPVVVMVPSILPDSLDTLYSKGLHEPFDAGQFPWQVVLFIVVLFTLLVALAVFMYRKFAGKEKPTVVVPQITPYDEAHSALLHLKAQEYLAKGNNKAYIFDLSEILKRYLGREYGGNIQESTAQEFLLWLKGSPLSTEHSTVIEQFIAFGEPIKFANSPSSQGEITAQLDTLTTLIDTTHQEIEAEKEREIERLKALKKQKLVVETDDKE